MQIVIDIDEDVFTRLFDNGTEDYAIANDDLFAIAKAIRKGIPHRKEQSMVDIMEIPKTFDEFAKQYGFTDKDEHYTNGSDLIPVFRVKQWLEHKHKHGEWKKGKIADENIWICSNCYYATFDESNFCPNCGADMIDNRF